jgi:hypothetical protein
VSNSRRFRVVAQRDGERSRREFVIDAAAPVAAALEAFSRLSSLVPDVVDVGSLHEAGTKAVTVTDGFGLSRPFRPLPHLRRIAAVCARSAPQMLHVGPAS